MTDRNPHTPEVAPAGQVEPGREQNARPMPPGTGMETGANDREQAGADKAPPFGASTRTGGAGTNPRT